uniref:Uncharacterized protein n=1 Tax=Lepeophtheirus salmonis TaxID=72036 RepID=A0A0K2TU00_LEPSM
MINLNIVICIRVFLRSIELLKKGNDNRRSSIKTKYFLYLRPLNPCAMERNVDVLRIYR